jgi:LacI family transcriptional regulator
MKKQGCKRDNLTIFDVAAEARVSISTVSRVLNNPHLVAPTTRLLVESVMKKRNYSPNAMARGLVRRSMKTIGVFMSDIINLHFSRAAFVLENIFFKQGYMTMLCNTGDDLEKKKKYIVDFASRKVDGLVLLGSVFNNPEIERMIIDYLPGTPVIISNSVLSVPNAYSVLIDHSVGMDLAVSHLVRKKHQKIAFVHSHETYNTKRKIAGFKTALNKNDIDRTGEDLFFTNPMVAGGEEFAERYLSGNKKTRHTALIFAEDSIAIGAVNVFRRNGLQIPTDIAVIGHDNSVFAQCSLPKLTSIDTKVMEISEVMANTLHDIFNKKLVGQSIMLRPDLVIRESA